MPTTQYSDAIRSLIKKYKGESAIDLWMVTFGESMNSLLVQNVVQRIESTYENELDLHFIEGSDAKLISEHLRFLKNPAIVILIDGKIEALFEGLVSYDRLHTSLENFIQQL